jgi:tripartite-type tricarboxylate transporter receptor subunit TctC
LIAQVVPYNGTPAVINALRGGQIDAAVEILGPMKPQIQAKAVRALAVMGDTRPAELPGAVLVSSQPGLSSFNVASWNALAAPARTPAAVIARLNQEAQKALNHPDVKKRLADLNVAAKHSTPEQLGRLLDADIVRWTGVIHKAGIPQQ